METARVLPPGLSAHAPQAHSKGHGGSEEDCLHLCL